MIEIIPNNPKEALKWYEKKLNNVQFEQKKSKNLS